MIYRKADYGPAPKGIRSSSLLRASLGEPPPLRRDLKLVPFEFWDGTTLPGGCNPLLSRPLREMDEIFGKFSYRLDGAKDDWCWNRRKVRGGTSWSMHSWATAVDINAQRNPYSYVFRSDMPPAMVAEIEALEHEGRPVWAWGGRFGRNGVGKTDSMHWQMNLTPAEARDYAVNVVLKGDDMLEPFIRMSYVNADRGEFDDAKGRAHWYFAAAEERPNRGWTHQDCLDSEQLGVMVYLLLGGE